MQQSFLFSLFRQTNVMVKNIDILGHVKPVRTASGVNLMTPVIHRKTQKRIVILPIIANQLAKD